MLSCIGIFESLNFPNDICSTESTYFICALDANVYAFDGRHVSDAMYRNRETHRLKIINKNHFILKFITIELIKLDDILRVGYDSNPI